MEKYVPAGGMEALLRNEDGLQQNLIAYKGGRSYART
jgi:hypothetical protein